MLYIAFLDFAVPIHRLFAIAPFASVPLVGSAVGADQTTICDNYVLCLFAHGFLHCVDDDPSGSLTPAYALVCSSRFVFAEVRGFGTYDFASISA